MSDLSDEFLSSPAGALREGSLVIRPSLRAALGRFLAALLGVWTFFAPFYLLSFLNLDAAPQGPAAFGVLDMATSLVLPIVLSFAPAVQLVFTRYIVDDEGIRERVQMLGKTEKRVRWQKVTALQHRRTFLDWLFRIERLDVIAYGARGTTLKLVGLPDARRLRNMVSQQMRSTANIEALVDND